MADNVQIVLNSGEVSAQLRDFSERKVVNALRSAVSTTTTWGEKQLEQRMADDTEIPVYAFKQYRVHKKLLGGYQQGTLETGQIWFGYRGVKARFLGRMVQQETGVLAGRYFFPGAFIATMPSGMTGVFRREGPKRTANEMRNGYIRQAIDEQAVILPRAQAIAEVVANEAEVEFVRRFRENFI
ncbi:MAG: hypothetical protein Q7U57_09740 [Methylovulum sp.]|nr:hypothetical protein [Methylovulum sp.]